MFLWFCVDHNYIICIHFKIIISLSDAHYLDGVPHLLRLSDQALLDDKLKRNSPSPKVKRNTSPMFIKDGLIQHSLHQSTRPSTHDTSFGSAFSDTDTSFDSASSDESMSCDELFYESSGGSAYTATAGTVGSIPVRSKKRRKCSKEQRKSLMHHMHIARRKTEKMHTNLGMYVVFLNNYFYMLMFYMCEHAYSYTIIAVKT